MSKFFTCSFAWLLVSAGPALASEEMTLPPPAPPEEKAATRVPGGSVLPSPLVGSRFAPLGKKSPFTLASTSEENADFAKDLILAGYVRMDGQDFVMVANRTKPDRLMVGTKTTPAAQGMVLVKVERDPSGDPTKMRAQIRKGSETAMLKYEAGAPAVAGQPVPGQVPPGQPPVPVPGQPQAAQLPPGAQGRPANQNPPVIRRRVIPIPPTPAR